MGVQVDMLLGENETLWVHVKLSNPLPTTLMGYWWTNVGVTNDIDGSREMRILTPATHWYATVSHTHATPHTRYGVTPARHPCIGATRNVNPPPIGARR